MEWYRGCMAADVCVCAIVNWLDTLICLMAESHTDRLIESHGKILVRVNGGVVAMMASTATTTTTTPPL